MAPPIHGRAAGGANRRFDPVGARDRLGFRREAERGVTMVETHQGDEHGHGPPAGGSWFWLTYDALDTALRIGRLALGVYCILARHCNRERQCHVAAKTIAERIGAGHRAVRSAIGRLVDAGLVETVVRHDDQGGRRANGYFLPALPPQEPPASECMGAMHSSARAPCTPVQGPHALEFTAPMQSSAQAPCTPDQGPHALECMARTRGSLNKTFLEDKTFEEQDEAQAAAPPAGANGQAAKERMLAGKKADPVKNSSQGSTGKSAMIPAVIEHYRKYHPRAMRNPNSKSKEWGLIAARLREGFTVADLCAAVDGCHRSPHHCGENDRGQKYQTLELIMRDASHVTMFAEVPERTPGLSEKERRGQRAVEQWVDGGQR